MKPLTNIFFVHKFVYKINARFMPLLHQTNVNLSIDPGVILQTKLDRIHQMYFHLSLPDQWQYIDCYDYIWSKVN